MMPETEHPFIARFTFKRDRAEEFLDEGRLVTQLDFDTIEEVMEYVEDFGDAIDDCNVIVNGIQVNLSDFIQ